MVSGTAGRGEVLIGFDTIAGAFTPAAARSSAWCLEGEITLSARSAMASVKLRSRLSTGRRLSGFRGMLQRMTRSSRNRMSGASAACHTPSLDQ